jgi:hypothetical protein
MSPDEKTSKIASRRWKPFVGREAKELTIDRRCARDPTSVEFEFVLALSDFLAKRKASLRFDVYVRPKKAMAHQCCWHLDPLTGDVICIPCEEVDLTD